MHFYRISYAYICPDVDAPMTLHILCSSQGDIDRTQVADWLHSAVIRAIPAESDMQVTEIGVHEFSTGTADYRMMF